jgi:hypothetical protein
MDCARATALSIRVQVLPRPERRPIVSLPDEEWATNGSDDVDDLIVALVLAACSDDPDSFSARPAQERVDKLTTLLGSQPQW